MADPGFWATKQVMLSAMNFMLAAHAAGPATVPMEGFDEGRVGRLAYIPGHHVVPLIVPVGYAMPGGLEEEPPFPGPDVASRNAVNPGGGGCYRKNSNFSFA